MENIILTDCDDVLLDWSNAFHWFMRQKGHYMLPNYDHIYDLTKKYDKSKKDIVNLIEEFNNSSAMVNLEPFRDAEMINDRMEDFEFVVITSMSDSLLSQYARQLNFQLRFPKMKIRDFIFLPMGADKDNALDKFKGTGYYWIEDKFENAFAGLSRGLKPILMMHDHNHYKIENHAIQLASDWKEIEIIIRG